MAYCTADDCRLYARGADFVTADFAAAIAHATGEFESLLRSQFQIPLTTTDQVVVNIVSMWAAGIEIMTRRAVVGATSEYAEGLIETARKRTVELTANPSLISASVVTAPVDGEQKSRVRGSGNKPVFDMTWGD